MDLRTCGERLQSALSAVTNGSNVRFAPILKARSISQTERFSVVIRVLRQRSVQRSGLSSLVLWGCRHRTTRPASRRCPIGTEGRFLGLY